MHSTEDGCCCCGPAANLIIFGTFAFCAFVFSLPALLYTYFYMGYKPFGSGWVDFWCNYWIGTMVTLAIAFVVAQICNLIVYTKRKLFGKRPKLNID